MIKPAPKPGTPAEKPATSAAPTSLQQRLNKSLRRNGEGSEGSNVYGPIGGPSAQDPAKAAANGLSPRVDLSSEALDIASRLSDDGISVPVLGGSVRLIDQMIISGGALVAALLNLQSTALAAGDGAATGFGLANLAVVAAAMLFSLAFFQAADAYQVSVMRHGMSQLGRVTAGWTLVFALFFLVRSLTGLGSSLPESWLGAWFVISLSALICFRLVIYRRVRHWMKVGRLERRAIIVGGGTAAAELIHELEGQSENDIRICGIFDDRANDRSPPVVAGYPKLGNIAALVEFARLARIDMLIVCIPLRAEKRVLELLQRLWVLPVDIRLSAHTDKVRFRDRGTSFIGTVPFVDVLEKPIADWDMVAKRAFDIVFAGLALILLSPVMVATAIAVKLTSKGPVFFRQKRYGFNNEVVDVLKFRSMFVDQLDPAAKKVVTRNDPRVTPVGRFIRKSSIDELPQLFNVLTGSLSLVGPRPHALNAHTDNTTWDNVVDGYFARHKVKPGVTGWAQINGWRGEVDTPEKIRKRVEFDIYYIENWSILLDLKILLMTPLSLFNTENAY